MTVLLAATACSSKEEKPMLTKRQADVVAMLKSYGDSAATTVGAPLEKWETLAAPCEGSNGDLSTDGRFQMTGHANIMLPEDQHAATLQRLHDQWQKLGYQITEFRLFPPDNRTGAVSARNPADDVGISLQSTVPSTAFALLIATPCYKPAPGEHPAG
jgi:hypothetical protein